MFSHRLKGKDIDAVLRFILGISVISLLLLSVYLIDNDFETSSRGTQTLYHACVSCV
jgi:hypothetical protein